MQHRASAPKARTPKRRAVTQRSPRRALHTKPVSQSTHIARQRMTTTSHSTSSFSHASPSVSFPKAAAAASTTTASPFALAQRFMSVSKRPIILNDTVEGLGKRGDVVNVRPGRARNHLLPKNLALYDTPANRAKLVADGITINEQKEDEEQQQASQVKSYVEVQADIIRNIGWNFHRDAVNSADNHVTRPITKKDIVIKLRQAKFVFIQESDIQFPSSHETLDHYGTWPVAAALHAIDTSGWAEFNVTIARPDHVGNARDDEELPQSAPTASFDV